MNLVMKCIFMTNDFSPNTMFILFTFFAYNLPINLLVLFCYLFILKIKSYLIQYLLITVFPSSPLLTLSHLCSPSDQLSVLVRLSIVGKRLHHHATLKKESI